VVKSGTIRHLYPALAFTFVPLSVILFLVIGINPNYLLSRYDTVLNFTL
jgi:hypothetical protein